MTFVYAGTGKFIIDHTEINLSYNGKGLGKKLVEHAVSFALKKGYTIVPLCPFAKKVFDKTPEYRHVLQSS
uniref:GNAT family N-acetyltransferase n=1 Tax=Flavobacterium ovatum TaxID=1928857 RepID=UPI003F4EE812